MSSHIHAADPPESYVNCPRYCKEGETRKIHRDTCSYYLEYYDDPQCYECPIYRNKLVKQREKVAAEILFQKGGETTQCQEFANAQFVKSFMVHQI